MIKELLLSHPLNIEQMYEWNGGLHMTEDEYKIQINEMVNTIKEIKIFTAYLSIHSNHNRKLPLRSFFYFIPKQLFHKFLKNF